MAKITKTNVIIPDLYDAAVQGAFQNKNAFMGSKLAQAGIVVIKGDMPEGRLKVGETIKVPYFGTIGEFDDVSTDGDALTPKAFSVTSESATVTHSGLAFEVSRWAQGAQGGDIYAEAARQTLEAAQRKMDALIVTAAAASGGLTKDLFSATSPRKIDWDALVDGKMLWQDNDGDIAGMVVHSRVLGDMWKLKDSAGHPLLVQPQLAGQSPLFMGIPVATSDKLPLTDSVMTAVTSTGTTPPVITLTGTPNRYIDLRVECTTLGALATSVIRYSIDGGQNWTSGVTTAATVLVGDVLHGGATTGVTLNIAAGNAAVNNVWTATSTLKHTTLLCKKAALAFWYNREALQLQTDKAILSDTDIAAIHLYAVAHRYSKLNGSDFPGIVKLRHN